jgi:4-amino-4-deoxy-L-arabinose transferase-like glycosyltransferase
VIYLRWLWRKERKVARILAVAVGILLICACGFAAAEIAALSTVRVVNAQQPAVIHFGAGAYQVSQDIGDMDFPDDSAALTVAGPGGRVPVQTVPQRLTPADAASLLLGAVDCGQVMSFTIQRTGSYQVTINDRHGMSGAWISEPYADVTEHVIPWALGIVGALLTVAVCLIVLARRGRIAGRVSPPGAGTKLQP